MSGKLNDYGKIFITLTALLCISSCLLISLLKCTTQNFNIVRRRYGLISLERDSHILCFRCSILLFKQIKIALTLNWVGEGQSSTITSFQDEFILV